MSGIFESLFSVKEKFTNSFMLELHDIVHNHQEITFDDLMEWLHRKDVCYMPSKHAMRAKLERNKVKIKKLRGTKKEEFLDADFEFPVCNRSYIMFRLN